MGMQTYEDGRNSETSIYYSYKHEDKSNWVIYHCSMFRHYSTTFKEFLHKVLKQNRLHSNIYTYGIPEVSSIYRVLLYIVGNILYQYYVYIVLFLNFYM